MFRSHRYCPAFSSILSGAASGQARTLNLRRSRLWQNVSRCRAVGFQLPSTLNSCGRVDDVQFFSRLPEAWHCHAIHIYRFISTTAIYRGFGTTDIRFSPLYLLLSLSSSVHTARAARRMISMTSNCMTDIAFVAGILGASVRGAAYTQCTASPCTARSRPSRSTSSLIRSPIMASSAPRMISDTMAS